MKSIYIFGNTNPAPYLKKSDWKNNIEIKKVVYQKSIFNFDYTPLPIERNEINLQNEWAANHIFDDFSKQYVKDILEKPADFILIDALGCVVPLREITADGVDSSVTFNKYMGETCEQLQRKKRLSVTANNTELTETQVRERTVQFCEKLTSVYHQDQIIVHKATYPEYFVYQGKFVASSSVRAKDYHKQKQLLKIVYDTMQWHMPYAHYIEMLPKTYAAGADKPFEYGHEYMEYLASELLLILFPESASRQIERAYSSYIKDAHDVLKREDTQSINLSLTIDECMYRFEIYNNKLRDYESKFVNLYNEIMHTQYVAGELGKENLTFEEFLSIENKYLRRTKKPHGKLWYIFVYPFSKGKKFFSYARQNGVISAIKFAFKQYKTKVKQ